MSTQMTSLVFDFELDPQIYQSIQDLRRMRCDVLSQQLLDIDQTLDWLIKNGSISQAEKENYRANVRSQLKDKIRVMKARLKDQERIYGDELELFYDLKK